MSDSLTKKRASLSESWQLCFMMMLAAALIITPELALATNAVEETLCKIRLLITGTTGKALATIAVTIIGIGALLGKISWGMALIVGMGVAIVFGASSLVDAIKPGATVADCT